jgi:spore maturation protein CgeB
MKIVMFYHSLVSDWNHGNAHFLRGVASELLSRGHQVTVHEPADGWSRSRMIEDHGREPLEWFKRAYPGLASRDHELTDDALEREVAHADLVIVHEWNDRELVARIGRLRRKHRFVLLFHDTHHRLVTDPTAIREFDLSRYDGILAFGDVLRRLYQKMNVAPRVWTWHEAADTRVFNPLENEKHEGDLVWIGNWGDDERTAELHEFLLDPVRKLGLKACAYGVRYPDHALRSLAAAGIEYRGWLPNFEAPRVFSRFHVTVHIPRGPYVRALPGIPTIRPFEALACGIPLISAPWNDVEGLFTPGSDFLVARDGAEMCSHLARVVSDENLRRQLSAHGLATIEARHTCVHRVDQLLQIHRQVRRELAEASHPMTIP